VRDVYAEKYKGISICLGILFRALGRITIWYIYICMFLFLEIAQRRISRNPFEMNSLTWYYFIYHVTLCVLGGNYVNFGVFKLYQDPAWDRCLEVSLQLALSIPLDDLMVHTMFRWPVVLIFYCYDFPLWREIQT
jgi:hypothetical protein